MNMFSNWRTKRRERRRLRCQAMARRSNEVQAAARLSRPLDADTRRRRALDDARGSVLREGVSIRRDLPVRIIDNVKAGLTPAALSAASKARKDATPAIRRALARAEMRAPGGVHLAEALREFSKFIEFTGGRDILLWGNGAAFDNVILASAYRALRLTPPWKFYNDRCYRTMKAAYSDVKMPRTGTHHNALDDAISQANHLIEIWKAARGLLV
jgi:hypothetical protein